MSAVDWQIIGEDEIIDPRSSGGWIRAYCPVHGGDHQRSLSINEETGFGRCHQCGAQVLVREINPKAAANIAQRSHDVTTGIIKVRDPKYITRRQSLPSTIQPWQQKEIDLLRVAQPFMEKHLMDERARAYLAGRGVAIETAQLCHAGYIPGVPLRGKYAALWRWADRIVFPVQSKDHGVQFVGRSLRLWKPGMDEEQHKEALERATIRRWLKTHAAGWLNFQMMEEAPCVVFVEGAFDALATISAGLAHTVAIIGTALNVQWLPRRRLHVVLALDGDESGREKSTVARTTLYEHGYDVSICNVPADGLGKDWSERYRLHGRNGLLPLWEEAS